LTFADTVEIPEIIIARPSSFYWTKAGKSIPKSPKNHHIQPFTFSLIQDIFRPFHNLSAGKAPKHRAAPRTVAGKTGDE
jgi:hypothetical protein